MDRSVLGGSSIFVLPTEATWLYEWNSHDLIWFCCLILNSSTFCIVTIFCYLFNFCFINCYVSMCETELKISWTWLKMFFIRINLVCNFQEFHFWRFFQLEIVFRGIFLCLWNRVEENNQENFQGIFFLSCVTEFYSPVCEIEYKHIFRRILFSRVSNWVKKTFFSPGK